MRMKLFVCAFSLCLLALCAAQSAPPTDAVESVAEYLPPVGEAEAAKLAADGYRYKNVRTLRLRHRREMLGQEYLPPTELPSQEYLSPLAAESAETRVADDGYRYKTVRKLKFRARHRRDISEIGEPSTEYLPPVEVALAPELKTILGDDGYRYKTVRRLKFRRHRREVDEAADAAPSGEYLPPAEEAAAVAPVKEAEPKSAELANDGYRYKTVRKIRYRYRH